jgi:hypothetical protein
MNVDMPTFLRLQEAQSVGKFFASDIKNKFNVEKIGSEDPKVIVEDVKRLKSKMGFND